MMGAMFLVDLLDSHVCCEVTGLAALRTLNVEPKRFPTLHFSRDGIAILARTMGVVT
jgi:hypothetical protein